MQFFILILDIEAISLHPLEPCKLNLIYTGVCKYYIGPSVTGGLMLGVSGSC